MLTIDPLKGTIFSKNLDLIIFSEETLLNLYSYQFEFAILNRKEDGFKAQPG
jgi:hypothetical protein